MGFQSSFIIRRRVTLTNVVYPFYGVAQTNATKDANLILNLSFRGLRSDRTSDLISLTSGVGESYYYAYPVEYGEALFMEVDSEGNNLGIGYGGWDGVQGDPISLYGPIVIPNVTTNGVTTNFYLYASDWPNLGTTYWRVS